MFLLNNFGEKILCVLNFFIEFDGFHIAAQTEYMQFRHIRHMSRPFKILHKKTLSFVQYLERPEYFSSKEPSNNSLWTKLRLTRFKNCQNRTK